MVAGGRHNVVAGGGHNVGQSVGGDGLLDGVGGGNWGCDVLNDGVDHAKSWTFRYGVCKGSANSVRLDDSRVMSWCPEDGGGTGRSQQCGENDGNHDVTFLLGRSFTTEK